MILAMALAMIAALGGAPAGDSLLSRKLTIAALDQEAELRYDSAIVLYRAARRADPADLVAEYHYATLQQRSYRFAVLRDEYAPHAAPWDPRGGFCWLPWIVEINETRSTAAQVVAAEHASGSTPCTRALIGAGTGRDPPVSFEERVREVSRAAREFPSVSVLWVMYAQLFEAGGQNAKTDEVFLEGDRALGHPLLRVQLAMTRIGERVRLGDTVGAHALQLAVRSAVMRDGRPGIIGAYLTGVIGYRELWSADGGEDRILARMAALSRSTGDWTLIARTLTDHGKQFIDGGEPKRAIPLLSRAVEIADSARVPDLQLVDRTLRGRAYTKAGRSAEAERDLRVAVAIGNRAARVYSQADAWHNLAHLYESESRWPEADMAVTRFVEIAKRLYSSEVTSLMDAGEIRWKAGWHASAEATFLEMVRAIERAKSEWAFAGQYYERSGDLDRAKSYYARAIAQLSTDPAALAGMTRVQTALGHADSAEFWARAHDARMVSWPPLEIPMLPDLLARKGRFAEATTIAHSWASRQVQAGNVEGAALATLQVARLLLDAGHPDSALTESTRTDSLGRAYNLTRDVIRAKVIRGTALLRLHRREAGLRTLDSALALASLHPQGDLLFEAHLARGDALGAERIDDALRDYDLAARAVENTTADIAGYFDRAGYREGTLRPFDGALKLLLDAPSRPGRNDEFVRWISRRNAAALAFGAAGTGAGRTREFESPGLTQLQRRLDPGDRLISYVVMDSTVAAMLVTSGGARLARLPIGAPALGAKVEAIRRPFVTTYSGRLDVARLRYDMSAAADLYAALIAPFSRDLAGAKRLLIAPDGKLHELAFDALVESAAGRGGGAADYATAKYLIDSFEVEYLPSPAFLPDAAQRRGGRSLQSARLLAVEYAAPGSGAELRAIRDEWPQGLVTTIDSSAATESAVRAAMPRFDVIHFAVHGSADTRDPLASHLQLAPDSLGDGFLHANAIVEARIRAKLVVLSACETNTGPVYGGEGVIGLARAFLAGGAGEVVATQWPIGAETGVLMKEFYRRLATGAAPAEALRAAKLMLRRSPATAHPFHWAGFVLVR